jgi:hypothetical protein
MKMYTNRVSVFCLAGALITATALAVPSASAEQNANLDKHARKVEKKLAKFRPGSYVLVDFRDGSQGLGSLGPLANENFQLTNADNNKTETYAYSDVAIVRKANEYIGEGSESHRPRLLLPIVISAAAAAAAVAVVETVR